MKLHDQTRAQAIAALLRSHGPLRAAEIVRSADERHRMMTLGNCAHSGCPVCHPAPASRDSQETTDA